MEYQSITLTATKRRRRPERPGACGLYMGPRLEISRRPRPALKPGDVLIEVKAGSICGTDIHVMQTDADHYSRSSVPARGWERGIQFGHEMAGRVVGLGRGVGGDLEIGDLVTMDSLIPCRRPGCRTCDSGQWNYCPNSYLIGLQADGVFGEFAVAPAAAVHPIAPLLRRYPEDLALRIAAMAEPVGVALHAYRQAMRWSRDPRPGVLILGGGPIGLFLAWEARTQGIGPIVVVEPNPQRAAYAERFADHVLPPDDFDAGRSWEIFGEDGPSVVFDACGQADLCRVVDQMAPGGAMVTLARTGQRMPFPNDTLITKGIALIGSRGHVGCVPLAIARLAEPGFEPEAFLTKTLNGLDELSAALQRPEMFADELKVVCRIG